MFKRIPLIGTYALLAYMPLSLFFSRWLSLYTGGLGQWDASKDILTFILLIASIYIAVSKNLFENRTIRLLFLLSAVYGLLHFAFAMFDKSLDTRSTVVATLYNGRIIAYLFIGYVIARVYGPRILSSAVKIILIVSTITCLVAVVQYLAPKDLMTHFGYSIERGVKPNFFIDDKPDFPRVMSTVRDPNSYGAFLIIPLTLSWLYLIDKKNNNRLLYAGLVSIHFLALLLTFSRGAWLGSIISISIATYLMHGTKVTSLIKRHGRVSLALLAVVVVGLFVVRDHYYLQNIILHSDQSTVMSDPNELRLQLQSKATEEILDKPSGYGPGTAGLASIESPNGTFLTENYYLQIGYELGLFGLIVFISILGLAYVMVSATVPSKVKSAILGSFWAYGFISSLIHLWSNEAVAAQWWLLAGLLAGTLIRNSHNNQAKIN